MVQETFRHIECHCLENGCSWIKSKQKLDTQYLQITARGSRMQLTLLLSRDIKNSGAMENNRDGAVKHVREVVKKNAELILFQEVLLAAYCLKFMILCFRPPKNCWQ